MIVAIAIVSVIGLVELWYWRPAIGAAAAVLLVALSVAIVIPVGADQQDRTSQRTAVAVRRRCVGEGYTVIIFVPPLYGSYLQNPFSFLTQLCAEIGGDIVFALDRGDDAKRSAGPSVPGPHWIPPRGDERMVGSPGIRPADRDHAAVVLFATTP